MNEPSNTILLVEDDFDDAFIFKRALKKASIGNPLQVVTDGQEAIDYLSGEGQYADRERYPLPFLAFLDLKLPYRDGFEVLTWIRAQPRLDGLIVVVLSGSDEPKDHQRAYSLGARSYLVKPPAVTELHLLMDSLQSHWSRTSERGPILNEKQL